MTQAFTAVLGLGSNMGDKVGNLRRAMALLEEPGGIRIVGTSRIYRTTPWGVTDQDWFVNACVAIETSLAPLALLRRCLAIEAEMGRVRERHWGPRLIDVDVLVYGDVTSETAELALPHPRITERGFVLVPLQDVAPDLVIAGRTVPDWIAKLDVSDVEVFAPSA